MVGEQDGWTEIVLRNGKRALVPSSEVAGEAEARPKKRTAPKPAPPPPKVPKADPTAGTPTPIRTTAPPEVIVELRAEVTRLRALVDELAALQPSADAATPPAAAAEHSWLASESLTMLGLALVIGVLLGGAVQRQRARRSSSLRF